MYMLSLILRLFNISFREQSLKYDKTQRICSFNTFCLFSVRPKVPRGKFWECLLNLIPFRILIKRI